MDQVHDDATRPVASPMLSLYDESCDDDVILYDQERDDANDGC